MKQEISVSFEAFGSSFISSTIKKNKIIISHIKSDPADINSYAILHSITINNVLFSENELRSGVFYPDTLMHNDAPKSITPCTVFGYIGNFEFDYDNDPILTKIKLDPRFKNNYSDYKLWNAIKNILN